MLKIVSFTICPFVQRATALLELKKIPYDIEFISLSDKPQWFLDIAPNGQVPVLITENQQVLFESDAIVEYIEEVYPDKSRTISPEERAQNRAWSYLATKNYLVQCSAQGSRDAQTLATRTEKLGKAFSTIEKQLSHTPFFSGDSLNAVDIAWLPLLHRSQIIENHTGYDFLGDCPKLKNWRKHLLSTGLAEKSVSADFEEKFTDFYLSEKTLLGRGEHRHNTHANACATSECTTSTCC